MLQIYRIVLINARFVTKDFVGTYRDLLKRHAACHEPDEQGVKRRRQLISSPRVAQACKACAAAKLKCDKDKVCNRCLRKGIPCEREPRNGNIISDKSPVADPVTTLSMSDMEPTVGPHDTNLEKVADSPKSQLLSADEGFQIMDSDFSSFLKNVMTPLIGDERHSLSHVDWSCVDPLHPFEPLRGLLDYTTKDDFGFEDVVAHNFSALPPTPSLYFSQPFATAMEAVTTNVTETDPDGKHLPLGIEAYQQSALGRWEPSNNDKADTEMDSLSMLGTSPHSSLYVAHMNDHPEPHINIPFPASTRDQVLSMTLDICKPEKKYLITKTFPTAEFFLQLVQRYFAYDRYEAHSFIHGPSFELGQQEPELLASIISAGAMLVDSKPLCALGLALQEVTRLSLPGRFEESNKVSRSIWAIQAFINEVEVAVWSGIKRKMEIAESHRNIPFTMLRRGGRFAAPSGPSPLPLPTDDGNVLQQKWLAWVNQESFNRLVYRSFIMDIQVSMAFCAAPIISFSELKTPLPCARSLWLASDADQWKTLYNSSLREPSSLSLVDYLRNPTELDESCYDITFSQLIIIHGIWGMAWQYLQLHETLNKPKLSSAALALQHQEITRIIDQFQVHMDDDASPSVEEPRLMLELVQLRLHIPFHEVESFAGKGSVEDARQALPILHDWVDTQEARQAIWHAGQVLSAAEKFRSGHLRGFFAIAVYQAALALWVFSLVSQGKARENPLTSVQTTKDSTTICLNGPSESVTRRFICTGKPPSCVLRPGRSVAGPASASVPIPLTDQESISCMVADMLADNFADCQALPPLVENLQQLLRHLGKAATTVQAGFPSSGPWSTSRNQE
ncbi:unnamed protein product [Clonostachys chloroleuca]|uniref:Zn(2)-C6 fungal-type domain-containing protein n=1 Tax=Clonostachys chloroleuca TaxID=1926264 RepID=A0AA35QFF2_9HYPO|nr:unnamed protein product [Clonostachys chloroleuca]